MHGFGTQAVPAAYQYAELTGVASHLSVLLACVFELVNISCSSGERMFSA
jgi:hypothetical protein